MKTPVAFNAVTMSVPVHVHFNVNQENCMKNIFKLSALALFVSVLSGCTGSVYNKEKNCDYDYLLHPAVSISKIIGGCGATDK